MTFHKRKNQEGVTLLLAILILAAITVIVFTVAAVTVGEIRISGDIGRSEPGITAAEASAEELLYQTVRSLGSAPDCATPNVQTYSSNGTKVTSCVTYTLPVPYNFGLPKNMEADFYVYNPVDQSQNPGYTSLTLTMNSGNQGNYYLCLFTTPNCLSGPYVDSGTLSPTGTNSHTMVLDPATKYQFFVVTDNVADATYTLSSSPTGLPAGTTTIQTTGANQGLTRKIRTTVPQ